MSTLDAYTPLLAAQNRGIPVVNPAETLRAGRDKWVGYTILKSHNIPTVPTWRIRHQTYQTTAQLCAQGAVIKPRTGHSGTGVHKAPTQPTPEQHQNWGRDDLLIQPYEPRCAHTDNQHSGALAIAAAQACGLVFAGVDLTQDGTTIVEINTNAGVTMGTNTITGVDTALVMAQHFNQYL